ETGGKGKYKPSRVILAIGNRGAPMRLKLPGEDLKIVVTPTEPVLPAFCGNCGAKRLRQSKFCRECGAKYAHVIYAPFEDDKVRYRLSDPNHYQDNHCLVVGAGDSAGDAGLDLGADRSDSAAPNSGATP